MKTVEHYYCEKCGTMYAEKKDALECEMNHKDIKAIIDTKYLAIGQDAKGYPQTITVRFSDGQTVKYKR